MFFSIAQLNLTVGALEDNINKIREFWKSAELAGSDILLTPELSLWGYPHYDQIFHIDLLKRVELYVSELIQESQSKKTALLIGIPRLIKSKTDHLNSETGRVLLTNSVCLIQGGQVVAERSKTLLPNYDVFDETRYFQPASENVPFEFILRSGGKKRIAIGICEDFWSDQGPWQSWSHLDCVLAIAASPYAQTKHAERIAVHAKVSQKLNAPLIYVNQVGATDELLFDGTSFVLDIKGAVLFQAPAFKEEVFHLDLNEIQKKPSIHQYQREPTLLAGLTVGIFDYFKKTGFKKAILGLSGGIDSAVVASLAVRALGAENVLGIAMPSQHSSSHSLEDAEMLARNLGISFQVRPIKFLFATMSRELGLTVPVAQENLQSRLRGNILMALSNELNSLVLTTGNKSEIACGYCTLYGDMCGALAPIGDLYKTEVYELAALINKEFGNWIPERTITKEPSAELRPNQKDQDSLPPYPILDSILKQYLEEEVSILNLCKQYPEAKEVFKKLFTSEFKRRQGAPVLKVSSKAFGVGRRVPIAADYFSAFEKS